MIDAKRVVKEQGVSAETGTAGFRGEDMMSLKGVNRLVTSPLTSAQEQVVDTLRHGGKLTGKRDRRGGLSELELIGAYYWQKEMIHANTVHALLRRGQIQEMQYDDELENGSKEVYFVVVKPWERLQRVAQRLEETLLRSEGGVSREAVFAQALYEALIEVVEEVSSDESRKQVRRLLSLCQ